MNNMNELNQKNALIFGSTGNIGKYVFQMLEKDGINVYGTTTRCHTEKNNLIYVDNENIECLINVCPQDIIIWCQGYNINDNILTYDELKYNLTIDVNINFILKTLHFLLINNKINNGAKMVIISSIWEENTRQNKLSYSISKSALSGLVKNISIELSYKNMLINNVLPGVIDNEMTRKTISQENIDYIKSYLGFNRLINYDDIYKTIKFLVIENSGITGQSIKVDLGFTNVIKYN